MKLQSYFRVNSSQSIGIEVKNGDSKQYDWYTTGDLIEGIVSIQTGVKLRRQDVEVIFCGKSFWVG